jgi:hypothetical protein
MNICTNSEIIATIDLDECVGQSLVTINTNFQLLKDSACFNFEEVEEKRTQTDNLSTDVHELSSFSSNVPKAIVSFDATTDPPTILNSVNIKLGGVNRLSVGVFQINFQNNFSNTDYLIIGNCSEHSSGSNYVWVQPTLTQTISTSRINIRDENGIYANPNYVSLLFFGR